jgi:hypothetical protein
MNPENAREEWPLRREKPQAAALKAPWPIRRPPLPSGEKVITGYNFLAAERRGKSYHHW